MTSRRAFLQAGSLGFLGVNLPQLCSAPLGTAAQQQGSVGHPVVARRRTEPDRHGIPSLARRSKRSPPTSRAFKSRVAPQVAPHGQAGGGPLHAHQGYRSPQGTHYAITGHEPNPRCTFPASARFSQEQVRNGMRRTYSLRNGRRAASTKSISVQDSSARTSTDGSIPIRAEDFEVADLTLRNPSPSRQSPAARNS
jgi:hypothetical protein